MHLNIQEDCLYRRLLDIQWRDGSLPPDPERIAKLARFDSETFNEAWKEVSGFFILRGGKLVNQKLSSERRGVNRKIAQKRSAGKASAINRFRTPVEHPLNDPDPDPEEEKRKTKKSNQKKVASQRAQGQSPRQQGTNPRRSPPTASPVVPEGLCQQSWDAYLKHRRESRKSTLKPVSQIRLMRWLVDQGTPETQAAIVDQTIRNGWTGLFELKHNTKVNGNDNYDRPIRGSADWHAERDRKRMDELEAREVLDAHEGTLRGETMDGEAWRDDE